MTGHRDRVAGLLAIGALLLVLGCGGGGGDGSPDDGEEPPQPVTVELVSDLSQQRSVTSGSAYADGMQCGDVDGGTIPGPFRACITFDLASLPAGATITSATLAARTRSQFRLRCDPLDSNGDGGFDIVTFEPANDVGGTGEVPLLTVVYTP